MTATPLLIFAGSARTGSHNRRLAQAATRLAEAAGARVTLMDLAAFELPLYHGDIEARGLPAAVQRLKAELHRHPAWLICSPEYNGSYTPLLKNAIDWASRPLPGDALWGVGNRAFDGKVVGLASTSNGAMGGVQGLAHLAPLLMRLQCWVAPRQCAVPQAAQAFDEAGDLKDAAVRERLQALIAQLLQAAERLQPPVLPALTA